MPNRKSAETKLQGYYLKKVQEIGKVGVWELDLGTGDLTWTDEIFRIFGVSIGTPLSLDTFLNCVHPDDREFVNEKWAQALKGEDYDIDHRIMADGAVRWVREKAEVEFDEKGTAVHAIGFVQDITDLKETQLQLERQALILEEGQKIGFFGSWDWNLQTKVIWWSDGLFAIYGIDPSEGPPAQEDDQWLEKVHPDDRDELLTTLRRAMETGSDYECEHRIIRQSDLEVRWIHAKAQVLLDATGQPERMVGVAHDVTERKNAEAALRKSESLLDRTGQVARVGGWELDARTMEVSWTRETYSIHEVPFGEMPSLEKALEFWHPDDRSVLQNAIERALDSAEPYDLELRFITASGRELHARTVCRPVVDNGSVVRLEGTIQDVTARLRIEAERQNLEQQLHQSQKIESVGRLAGGVAHDFNNMLGVILGHLDLALVDIKPDNPLHEHLTAALNAAERSADLTNQLLAFARKQTVAPRVLDLNEAIANMLGMLRRLIGEEIDLQFDEDASIGTVKMDPSQVNQILANLCVNARDAIDGPGVLTLTTGETTFDGSFCEERPGATPGDYIFLVVRDTGKGMDEQTKQRVFEPFFTTKGEGKGTGLGLSTVYGIVKQNGGYIDLESSPGQGAIFRVYIPRHRGTAERVTATPLDEPVESVNETILVVEDETAILDLTRTMLEEFGYKVLTAGTPMEAISIAERYLGEIHLLITDVVMPEMNGRQLAGKLLALYPDIRRLFMSGYTADLIAHRGVLNDDVNFLQKPFRIVELAEKVKKALQ